MINHNRFELILLMIGQVIYGVLALGNTLDMFLLYLGPAKKPIKKGMATAKQRLSKILGINKMFR